MEPSLQVCFRSQSGTDLERGVAGLLVAERDIRQVAGVSWCLPTVPPRLANQLLVSRREPIRGHLYSRNQPARSASRQE